MSAPPVIAKIPGTEIRCPLCGGTGTRVVNGVEEPCKPCAKHRKQVFRAWIIESTGERASMMVIGARGKTDVLAKFAGKAGVRVEFEDYTPSPHDAAPTAAAAPQE